MDTSLSANMSSRSFAKGKQRQLLHLRPSRAPLARFNVIKRSLVRLLVAALLLSPALALAGSQYNTPVSATSTATLVTFGFPATYILLKNDGSNEVYVDLVGGTATTSSFEIKSGEAFSIPPNWSNDEPGRATISIVCAAAETATVRVLALR